MSEADSNVETLDSNWEGVARRAADSFAGGIDENGQGLLRELLVFGLDGGFYAISVERIREIVRMRKLTPLPRSPDWILGVMALRGEIVEVVNLCPRLGLPDRKSNRSSRIIVLHGDAERVTGVLADSVSQVIRVSEDSIMPAQSLDVHSINEVCRHGDEFISILDPDIALGFQND